jgi:signal transduction histidine kinase
VRTRLLPLLIILMAGVLLALGFPLAVSVAAAQQQRVVIDRIDDTARFAALAQFITEPTAGHDERRRTLRNELDTYASLYGIRAGVLYRDDRAMAKAPETWQLPIYGAGREAFKEALLGRRSHDPPQVWPWQDGRIVVASPVVRDGDVVAVVVLDSPTDGMRSRTLRGWLLIAVGEAVAMLVAVGAAIRLTGWVLLPVRTLDAATHDIASGRMRSRVAASGGPPELRRLARSFNEMADNVEDVLEQQRAFVADASHQLRNPLSALLLRIEMLGMELPAQHQEFTSVQAEGKRLARVLDDLLDLALAEHAPADLQLTDVAEVAAERVEAWRPVAERKGVLLESAGQSAATAWADPVALSSALDAVVDNAVKFTPEGEHVTVSVASEGGHVTLVVADGGPGLNDEELERIGDRFWRSNRHQNISGSGLGLSITRALLSAGGASISYARNEPRGLRAVITVLRNKPTPDDDEVTAEELPTESRQSCRSRRSRAVEPRESAEAREAREARESSDA